MSFHFRDKDVMSDSIKYFVQVQVEDISCSSLTHQWPSARATGSTMTATRREKVIASCFDKKLLLCQPYQSSQIYLIQSFLHFPKGSHLLSEEEHTTRPIRSLLDLFGLEGLSPLLSSGRNRRTFPHLVDILDISIDLVEHTAASLLFQMKNISHWSCSRV